MKWSVILAKVNTKSAEFPLLRKREYAALSQTIVIVSQDKQCEKLEISQGRGNRREMEVELANSLAERASGIIPL